MRVKITDRCKVWEINDKEGMAEVKFSTSRKVKENSSYDQTQVTNGVARNGYIADYRSFVRFVGHAYNQLKDVQIGDTITNLDADMSTEPYWDSNNNCVAYPKNEKITVFAFEKYNPENQEQGFTRNLDKAPQVAEASVSQSQVAPVVNTAPVTPVQPISSATSIQTAEDECPF